MGSSLTLHQGAREVDRGYVESLGAPPAEGKWFPIAHKTVLSHVESLLHDGGFAIQRSQLALSHRDNRFFCCLDTRSTIVDGITLSCGVMNSVDRSIGIRFLVGERVWICDNLGYSSSHVVSSKHSRFGLRRFHGKLAQVVQALPEHVQASAQRFQRLRTLALSDDRANSLILQMYEKGIVSTRLLPRLLEEYRSPRHPEFQNRTAFSLWNAATEVLKERRGQPALFASLTIQLTGLLDRGQAPSAQEAP